MDNTAESGKEKTGIDDVMVKDPQCGVYFPQRNSIVVSKNGENLYFCSTECRDKYLNPAKK